MNDNTFDDNTFDDNTFDLASAYLDDAVTPAERARAEADTEVMTLVTELRGLADRLREVEPPATDARDQAVATALAGWSPPYDARVSTSARPTRSSRLLAYAAALLAVGVVGVVAVTGLRGTTDDAATSMSDEELTETFALDQTDDMTDAMDAMGDVAESMAEPEQTADSDDADRSTEILDSAAEDGAEVVDLAGLTDAELALFAVALLAERDAADQTDQTDQTDGATIGTDGAVTCDDVLDDVLTSATYADRDALFGISERDTVARVVDPVDCAVLAEASLERAGD